MDWSLVPARKRIFNFWPGAREMKDVKHGRHGGTKARHKPRSGSAVHAPEVRSTSGIRECSERLGGNF